jgi:hypothetical protein
MASPATIKNAAESYLSRREQMGPRKAAAHVIQEFGVTSHELSAYLAANGLLLRQHRWEQRADAYFEGRLDTQAAEEVI